VISPSQRFLPDNTEHPQQTNIHAPGRIRTRNPSKRSAADPRLRQLGRWDRLDRPIKHTKFKGTHCYYRYEACGLADSSMGNSTSQAVHKRAEGRQSWNNSFPRDPRAVRSVKSPQNKVLPERIPGQRLRVTDNGAILQNGGTLSGRRQIISLGERFGKHDQVCTGFVMPTCYYTAYSRGDKYVLPPMQSKRVG
jgi:hypothetical protein